MSRGQQHQQPEQEPLELQDLRQLEGTRVEPTSLLTPLGFPVSRDEISRGNMGPKDQEHSQVPAGERVRSEKRTNSCTFQVSDAPGFRGHEVRPLGCPDGRHESQAVREGHRSRVRGYSLDEREVTKDRQEGHPEQRGCRGFPGRGRGQRGPPGGTPPWSGCQAFPGRRRGRRGPPGRAMPSGLSELSLD